MPLLRRRTSQKLPTVSVLRSSGASPRATKRRLARPRRPPSSVFQECDWPLRQFSQFQHSRRRKGRFSLKLVDKKGEIHRAVRAVRWRPSRNCRCGEVIARQEVQNDRKNGMGTGLAAKTVSLSGIGGRVRARSSTHRRRGPDGRYGATSRTAPRARRTALSAARRRKELAKSVCNRPAGTSPTRTNTVVRLRSLKPAQLCN